MEERKKLNTEITWQLGFWRKESTCQVLHTTFDEDTDPIFFFYFMTWSITEYYEFQNNVEFIAVYMFCVVKIPHIFLMALHCMKEVRADLFLETAKLQ